MGPFTPLSAAARTASLRDTLAEVGPDGTVRVFAYGSLIWRPCFTPASSVAACLAGYRRRLCIWTVQARGTPDAPGLGLGLEPGEGCCDGLLLEVGAAERDVDLAALWEREMLTGVYRPRWVEVAAGGTAVTALTFVVDPAHPQYAPSMRRERQAALIARAEGVLGSCRDYVAQTVEALARHGFPDEELAALLACVDSCAPSGQ